MDIGELDFKKDVTSCPRYRKALHAPPARRRPGSEHRGPRRALGRRRGSSPAPRWKARPR
ncbi:hypothetical protein AB5I41_25365 [Sphingomonas sp. MMS24-JH45]